LTDRAEERVSQVTLALKQAVASWAWRWSAPRRRPGCIVLMYHRVGRKGDPFPHLGVAEFERQLDWLGRHCDVIGPGDLRAAAARSRGRVPILITFDDGTRDYHDLAYPLLKRYGMPAVVFPITDYIDHPRLLWFDRLHLAVHGSRAREVELPWQPGQRRRLGAAGTEDFILECKRHLKSLPDEEVEPALARLVGALGDPTIPDVGRQIMTWDEVRRTLDLTTYGGHTHTHPMMSKIDPVRLQREVRTCRERLAVETGVTPTLFAYPNGDYTPDAKSCVAENGFEVAFSIQDGMTDETTDWLEVRRVGVGNIVPTLWMMRKTWN
jgi:peptidoglycan/xylan/chitin deacetylase (PgdA/CDA1 family)